MNKPFTTSLFRRLSALMATVALMLIVASCSGGKADEVAQRLDEGEPMTQDDYRVMIDYIKDPINENAKLLEKAFKDMKDADFSKLDDLKKESDEIADKYPHFHKFLFALQSGRLDADNQKALGKIYTDLYKKLGIENAPAMYQLGAILGNVDEGSAEHEEMDGGFGDFDISGVDIDQMMSDMDVDMDEVNRAIEEALKDGGIDPETGELLYED